MSGFVSEKCEIEKADARVLKEVTLLVGDCRIRYCLVGFGEQYLLEMEGGGTRCVLDLGDTLSRAARVMEMFVHGRVTPNTAEDILEDLYAQGAFEEKSV